ncbi:MAG: xanthine dehydrogenase accessory protein XdhC [Silicimonas sp.]|nr:xanthine dehydrogenase accessory protein XdhC [Silicimonas sp.]
MSFPRDQMRDLPGDIVRVVVAETRGSVPREVGASMLVTDQSVEGTIGGGALEFEAIRRAREVLKTRQDRFDRMPLGPALGQCCGGSVSVLIEYWDAGRLDAVTGQLVARPLPGQADDMPLAVVRLCAEARAAGTVPDAGIVDGWMVEPVSRATREIWVWGAGHVGRAIVGTLTPLPGLRIRWADSDRNRFPTDIPGGVDVLIAENPADLVTLSAENAEHLVLTYSHALDLELCHRILGRPFATLGLIGSATKRARFLTRLKALGHSEGQISRIVCPIGDPALGKHPQAIALGVAADIVRTGNRGKAKMGERA